MMLLKIVKRAYLIRLIHPLIVLAYFAWFGASLSGLVISLILGLAITCLGVEIYLHRYLSHRSFEMAQWPARILGLVSFFSGSGSTINWVSMHRQHHRFSDTDSDPHSPNREGHWQKFRVLFLFYGFSKVKKGLVRELVQSPWHRFYHRYYSHILLGASVVWAVIDMNSFVYAFCLPMEICRLNLGLINYLGHQGKVRSAETGDFSVNLTRLPFLLGAHLHHDHHMDPGNHLIEKDGRIDFCGRIIDRFLRLNR